MLGALREELLPAQDRAARSFITAVKALREFRATGVSANIAKAAQVNLAEQAGCRRADRAAAVLAKTRPRANSTASPYGSAKPLAGAGPPCRFGLSVAL